MKFPLLLFGLLSSFRQIRGTELIVERVLTKNEAARTICRTANSWMLLPDNRDCHKFYVCVNHYAEEFNCAAGYYFDKTNLRCQLGVCPHAQMLSKCQPNAVQRVANKCSAFAVCKNGQFQLNDCDYDEYFNLRLARCQPISTSVDHKCSCILPENAVVSNVDDCATYYTCIDGKAVLQHCPRGHYYNERISSCLPDLEGICLTALAMSLKKVDVVEVCQQFGANSVVLRPDRDDCAKFFLCMNGRVFAKHCLEGFYYDDNMNHCLVDKEGVCKRKFQQKQLVERAETTDNTQHKPSFPKRLPQLLVSKPLQDAGNEKNEEPSSVAQMVKAAQQPIEDNKKDAADEAEWAQESAADSSVMSKKPQKNLIYDKLSSKFMNF